MKRFVKRQWPLLAAGFLLLVAALYLAKAGTELIKTPALLKDVISGKGTTLQDVHYSQDNPDKAMKWVLDAQKVRFSEDRNIIVFYGFELSVVPREGASFRLSGREGKYVRNSGEIELSGNLEGVLQGGYKILAQDMVINEKTGRMKTGNPVRIDGPFFSVKGQGLVADLKTRKARVLADVTTVIQKELI